MFIQSNETICNNWDKNQTIKESKNMRHTIFILILLFGIHKVSLCQSTDQNYISTKTMTNDAGTTFQQSIQYFDGLGRPVETVAKGITPAGADWVTLTEYDAMGRKSNVWLPAVIGNGNAGKFVTATSVQTSSRTSNVDNNPYAKPVYEASPLNRVTSQFGAGVDWHNNSKAVKTEYPTYASLPEFLCNKYYVEGTGISSVLKIATKNYGANLLIITKTTEEDGNILYEFRNNIGQLILSRQKNIKDGGEEWIDTYRVYDDFGNLCYVLQPKFAETYGSLSNTTFSDTHAGIATAAFVYKYDKRNRCIKKRLPGCDWIEMVYDSADRLILSQDGVQRAKTPKQWTVNKYDGLGRMIYSGLINREIQESEKETVRNNVITESYVGTTQSTAIGGYSCSYFTGEISLIVANYYDKYQFLSLTGFSNLSYDAQTGYATRYGDNTNNNAAKGLLTGSQTRVFTPNESTPAYICAATYYDYRGRPVQTKSERLNYKRYEYLAYNFTGQVTDRKVQDNFTNGYAAVTEVYHNDYDQAGRLLKTTHALNGGTAVTLTENTYDELGRLITTQANGKTNLKLTYTYNTRGWIKDITGTNFTEKLYYNSPFAQGGTACWNGNISTAITNGYLGFNYKYDNLNRLTVADNFFDWGNEVFFGAYSSSYGYDKNSNIEQLFRIEDLSAEVLTFSLNGNRRSKAAYVTDEEYANGYEPDFITDNCCPPYNNSFTDYTHGNTDVSFTYDPNGALTSDPYKGCTIAYHPTGMPSEVAVSAINGTIQYQYSASGEKLKTTYRWHSGLSLDPLENVGKNYTGQNSSKITEYYGNKVYNGTSLERILLPNGYIQNGAYYFYLRDHLGNNCVTANANGDVLQSTSYHPYGKPIRMESWGEDVQPYKFGGKERDEMLGMNLMNFEARMLDDYGSFTSVDPMAEEKPWMSSYIYCSGNPISRIDPDGRIDFWYNGRNIGNNGVDDHRVYVIKTTEKNFGSENDNSLVAGAGLSKKDRDATIAFITANSGNSDAFAENSIAFTNSIEIVGSAVTRKEMVGVVSQDDGSGGESDANNREYGGSINSGIVSAVNPGPISKPGDSKAEIELPANKITFHGHPSGTKLLSNNSDQYSTSGSFGTFSMATSNTRSFTQSPSPTDLQNARSNTCYVFGRSRNDGMVYIYNSNGVQAVIPMKYFINPR